ncbi:hypothetical protein HHX47_DHR5000653 [Lentinula edodes]|nr:hypothetical protein HHX47_DHR5000653 [Lentinula edodes]
MAQYLTNVPIQGQISLDPQSILFLCNQLAETKTEVNLSDKELSKKLRPAYAAPFSKFEHQNDAKLVAIALLKNVLSPVRRVPPEILSEIFEWYCFSEKKDVTGWRHDIVACYVPTLVRVCVAWRNTAHGTPRIWSKFCLDSIRHHRVFEHASHGCWIGGWLSRSRGVPLDISLNFRDHSFSLEKILTFHRKIRSLSIGGYLGTWEGLFRRHMQRAGSTTLLPELEHLFILDEMKRPEGRDTFYHSAGSPTETITIFCKASKLRTVKIKEPRYDYSVLQHVQLPAAQLTSLDISVFRCDGGGRFDPKVYAEFLNQCSNLVNLQFHPSILFDPSLSLHFPALRKLVITCAGYQENATKVDLLHCLTTPLLHDLTIQCGWPTVTHIRMIIENLLRLKARSEIVLSSLTLVNFWDGRCRTAQTTAMIVDLLAHFPTIQSFVILDLKADVSDLFQAMTFGAQDHLQLLPHLTDLQVKWDHQAYRQYPVALNVMIKSRCWAGSERDLTDDRHEFCRSSEQWRLKRVVMRGFPEFQREIQPIRDISGLDLNYMNWWED